MKGRFITLEGGEGAGKSTQIDALVRRLQAAGVDVVMTREPGGTPAAEKIRSIILSGAAQACGPDGEAVLFAAARADHVTRVIRPALESGAWVVCDRFIDSTRVYQGAAGGVPAQTLSALERAAIGDTRPDLTLILDVPAEIGLARAARRQQSAGDTADRFEREALETHEKRRQAFLAIAAAEPARCVVVDATQPVEMTAAAIWAAVSARLLSAAA